VPKIRKSFVIRIKRPNKQLSARRGHRIMTNGKKMMKKSTLNITNHFVLRLIKKYLFLTASTNGEISGIKIRL